MALGKHNARVKVLSERSPGARRRAGRPGDRLCAGRWLTPPTGHALPGTITAPDGVPEGPRVGGAQLRGSRIPGHRLSRGPRLDPGGAEGGRGAAQPRVGGRAGGAHAIEEYYRASEAPRLLAARGYSDAELGAHAGPPDTSLMLAPDPRLVRLDRLRPGTGPGRRRRGRGPDPRDRRARPARRRGDRARTVEAIRKSIGHRATVPAADTNMTARRGRAARLPHRFGSGCSRGPGRLLELSGAVAPVAFFADYARFDLGPAAARRGRARRRDVPGMPPVPDPTNLYSETAAGKLSPAVAGALPRVYVPNVKANDVYVIDPPRSRWSTSSRSASTRSTSCRPGT